MTGVIPSSDFFFKTTDRLLSERSIAWCLEIAESGFEVTCLRIENQYQYPPYLCYCTVMVHDGFEVRRMSAEQCTCIKVVAKAHEEHLGNDTFIQTYSYIGKGGSIQRKDCVVREFI